MSFEPEPGGITTQEHGSKPPFPINSLPDDVYSIILSRMPIRDAVQTSMLSKAWHRRWRSIRALVLDQSSISRHYLQLAAKHLQERRGRPVDFWLKNSETDILRRVMQDHETVEELVLDGCALYLPAGLYAGSGGFPKLTVLTLKGMWIDADNLGGLISSCPLLSHLTLDIKDLIKRSGCTDHLSFPTIVVSAAHLRHLKIQLGGTIWCIHLIAPQLISAWISLTMFKGCNINHLLGDSPRLQKLTIASVSFCITRIPYCLHQPLCHLLELDTNINFEIPYDAHGALCLFRSSPALIRLRLDCWTSDGSITVPDSYSKEATDIWNTAAEGPCCFPRLKHLVINRMRGSDSDVAFLRMVFQQAPVLAELNVKGCSKIVIKEPSGIEQIKDDSIQMIHDLLASRKGKIRATID